MTKLLKKKFQKKIPKKKFQKKNYYKFILSKIFKKKFQKKNSNLI